MQRLSKVMASVITASFLPITVSAAPVTPQTDLSTSSISDSLQIGGSARFRYENKHAFKFGAPVPGNNQDYWLQQLRLHAHLKVNANISLFVEGQDARIYHAFGQHSINNRSTPNIYEDHFDLHTGYLDLAVRDNAYDSRIRLGRQKFNLGVQRMVASLEWVNTARVWDGLRITTHLGDRQTIDLFSSRLVPVNPGRLNNHSNTRSRMFNSTFHGLYYTYKPQAKADMQLELYALLRNEAAAGDSVFTWGSRVSYKLSAWDADAEGMIQTGSYGHLAHRAYAIHAGAGYSFYKGVIRLSAAYNYGSGDSSATDQKHQTFDNQYPLNHAYYGYMDFFSLQNMHNVEFVAQGKVAETWKVRVAWQGFWLANPGSDAWYNAGGGVSHAASPGASSKVGDEVDVTISHRFKRISTTGTLGYGHFFTSAYIAQQGQSRDADFLFTQSKWSF